MGYKKRFSAGLALPIAVVAMTISSASPAAALGLNPVTINCGDGSAIHANVDLTELTKLQGAMQGMVADPNDPTDMGCDLSQDSQANQTETHIFVIGSGVYGESPDPTQNCAIAFKLKASVDEDGQARGFQTVKILTPDNCGAGPGKSSLKANVTCLAAGHDPSGNKVAEMRGIVTDASGPYFQGFAKAGDGILADVTESQHGVPDQITQEIIAPSAAKACIATGGLFSLNRGDIDIHE
jgi:hypothetical protein